MWSRNGKVRSFEKYGVQNFAKRVQCAAKKSIP